MDQCAPCNEHAYHWSQDGNHCCVACGLPDSLRHRLWTCCRSGDLRASFTPEALDLVASLPTVVSCRGWFLRSCLFEPWVQYCLSLPSQLPPPACALDGLPILDLFTDGSCLHPGSLAFRLAAWSVCLAGPCSVSYGPESCHVLAASPLDGLTQTAFRAELKAVVAALTYARTAQGSPQIRLWVDCQGVVDKFLLLVGGQRLLRRTSPNADLWQEVLDLVWDVGRERISITKVPAHVELTEEHSEFERWLIVNNACADRAAGQSNRDRPDSVWRLWEHHVAQTLGHQELMGQIWRHILAVGKRWTDMFKRNLPGVTPQQTKQAKIFPQGFRQDEQFDVVPRRLGQLLGFSFSQMLLDWWNNIVDFGGTVSLRWVSFIHLHVSFQLQQRHPGLVRVGRKWVDPYQQSCILPENLKGQVRIRAFRMCVQQMWKCIACKAKTATTRVLSNVVVGHFGACSIPVKLDELEKGGGWFSL